MAITQEQKSPHVSAVLAGAQEDLENAEFPGYVGKVFNPVRDVVLVPVTSTASNIIVGVTGAIPLPFVDNVSAFAMNVPITAMKFGYGMIPHKDVDKEAEAAVAKEFELAFHSSRKPQPLIANMYAVIGFAANTALDLATLPFGNKMGEWYESSKQLIGYIGVSGIWKELLAAFADPQAVENMLIIARAQAAKNDVGTTISRRARTAFSSLPPNVDDAKFKDILANSTRYVRFATAAYGVAMIDNANLLQVFNTEVVKAPLVAEASQKARKGKMRRYLNIDEEDMLKITNTGGNLDVVKHFVAVDRPRGKIQGAVVLSIRGTYTISGLKIDVGGYSRDFCDGKAHAGIADAADNLWKEVKTIIVNALISNPGYDLVVTGHSLGAGTAALLTLKLKYEDILATENAKLKNVKVRCYAYAPPPVYYKEDENTKINAAMKDTFAFIHENDCVPFASADAVRDLAATMNKVDKYPKGTPILKSSPLMAAGIKPIPDGLAEKILESNELPAIAGAEKLAIPAPFVMWMRKTHDDANGRPMYNTMFCRPKKEKDMTGTNDLNILLDFPKMINDHMSPQYERAINSLRQQSLHKISVCKFSPPSHPEEHYR